MPSTCFGGEDLQHFLDVFAAARRLREEHLGDAGQAGRNLAGKAFLTLGDSGQRVVVEFLHDAEEADFRLPRDVLE